MSSIPVARTMKKSQLQKNQLNAEKMIRIADQMYVFHFILFLFFWLSIKKITLTMQTSSANNIFFLNFPLIQYNPSGSGDSDAAKKASRFSARGRPVGSRRSARRRRSTSEEEESSPTSEDDFSDEPKQKKIPARGRGASGGGGGRGRGRKPKESESEVSEGEEEEEASEPESDQSEVSFFIICVCVFFFHFVGEINKSKRCLNVHW